MQRRLDIAMGLLHRPQVLFLDEPTTGLDPEARADLWREIERLATEERMTILLTTHYLEEADRLASRLAIVDRGRVVVEGTPDELKSDLQGDTIQVELADPAGRRRARRARGTSAASATSTLDGRTLRARARDGGAAIPAVLAALEPHGVKVASVTLARPSLDDVYLRHAGARVRGWRHDGRSRRPGRSRLRERARAHAQPRVPRHHARRSRSSGCCCSARCSRPSRRSRASRRLVHRLPHARRSS